METNSTTRDESEQDGRSGAHPPVKPAPATGYRRVNRPPPKSKIPTTVTVESVQAELSALDARESGWIHTLLGLGISLVLFLKVGVGDTPLTGMLIVALVVLIHEAGHFVGMKIFRYSNVRMFFIPFMGGVVTGDNPNPEGWKRATVILLGPVPGIILGCVIGAVCYFHPIPILTKFAATFLILNGLNLVPLVPLDGGRFFQEVIFSRNRFVEAAFTAITGALLAAISAHFGEWVMAGIGGMIVLSSLTALKIGKLALKEREARGSEFEVTDQLIQNIHAEFPLEKTPKGFANHAKQIREIVRRSPPSSWATVGLVAVYFSALSFAILAVGAHTVLSLRDYNRKFDEAQQAFKSQDFATAEAGFRDALERGQAIGGDDHRVARTYLWIAFTCFRERKFEEAEKNAKRALEIRERTLGSTSALIAPPLRVLADCADQLNRPEEAIALRKRAVEIESAAPQPKVEERHEQ